MPAVATKTTTRPTDEAEPDDHDHRDKWDDAEVEIELAEVFEDPAKRRPERMVDRGDAGIRAEDRADRVPPRDLEANCSHHSDHEDRDRNPEAGEILDERPNAKPPDAPGVLHAEDRERDHEGRE